MGFNSGFKGLTMVAGFVCFNNPPIYTGNRDSHTRQVDSEKPDEEATLHPGLLGVGQRAINPTL